MIDIWFLYWIAIIISVIVFLIFIITKWIATFNKFQELKTEIENQFANLKVIMQQRAVMIPQLANVVEKYSDHEYLAFRDITEARAGLAKGDINSRVDYAQKIENTWVKLQAVFERYPNLKANSVYQNLMGDDSISNIESRFRNSTELYNKIVKEYNYFVRKFPESIIAKVHNFNLINHFSFPEPEYDEIKLFNK